MLHLRADRAPVEAPPRAVLAMRVLRLIPHGVRGNIERVVWLWSSVDIRILRRHVRRMSPKPWSRLTATPLDCVPLMLPAVLT